MGERISACEAERIGLVNRVVWPDRLLVEAVAVATTIAKNAPISARLAKEVLRQTYEQDLEAVMQLEVGGMMAYLATNDIKEGTSAFLEKREPS